MARNVREIVQVDAGGTLDELMAALETVRRDLPAGADPRVSLRGCETFGRHVAVSYFRPQTAEEAATDARYAEAAREMIARQDRERDAEAEGHRFGRLPLAA